MSKIDELSRHILELQLERKKLENERVEENRAFLFDMEWLCGQKAIYEESLPEYGRTCYYLNLLLDNDLDNKLQGIVPYNGLELQKNDSWYQENLHLVKRDGDKLALRCFDVYIVNDEKTLHISSYSLESIIELAEQLSIKITLTEEIKTQIHLLNRLQDCSE